MDFIKFLSWLQTLPKAGKVLSIVVILIVSIILLFFAGCGTVKTTINDSDHNNISVNTSPSTSVDTSLDSLTVNM